LPYCDECGFPLPDGAAFCPNCGAAIKKKAEAPASQRENIMNFLSAGLVGAFLSVTISLFSMPVDLYFIPSFVSSLIVIYLAKTEKLKDATIIAMTVFLFANAIINGVNLGTLYINNKSLSEYPEVANRVPTLLDVIMYTASPIMAIVAGYIGVNLTPKRREEHVPVPSGGGEEGGPGGIIYSLKGDRDTSASQPHNV
jgi:hypothetical protein